MLLPELICSDPEKSRPSSMLWRPRKGWGGGRPKFYRQNVCRMSAIQPMASSYGVPWREAVTGRLDGQPGRRERQILRSTDHCTRKEPLNV